MDVCGKIHTLLVEEKESGARLDKFIASKIPSLTRTSAAKLCEEEKITNRGVPLIKSYLVQLGDRIDVWIPEPQPLDIMPEDIPLEIPYEDEDLLVVNKPKGMVVHPAAGHYSGTLVNALLAHCGDSLSGINGVIRPGIVHRIDKDTSGLLVVAKNDAAHQGLADQIKEHSFTREYEAVVYGNLKEDAGTIQAPIGRHPNDRKKMAVQEKNARDAITHYTVLRRFSGFTHIRLRLETGRTHQIRVHMAYKGHPVAGDAVYGPKRCLTELQGQCLHARTLGFLHPTIAKKVEITSDLPIYFIEFLKKLERME